MEFFLTQKIMSKNTHVIWKIKMLVLVRSSLLISYLPERGNKFQTQKKKSVKKIKTNIENKVTKIFRMNLQRIFEKEK